jgi:predicted transcriptional regulator
MKPPCELIVWYVIPTIRAELAKEMIKLGLSQKEVSERLGITQSAVSQYVKDKLCVICTGRTTPASRAAMSA